MKVAKFGGTSLASAEQVKKVFQIVITDSARKIVVVSAPGKRFAEDDKVTDLLIACGNFFLEKRELGQIEWRGRPECLDKVLSRYAEIASGLGLGEGTIQIIQESIINLLYENIDNPLLYMEKVKASGEDNHAKLVAAYFQKEGVPAHYINPREAGLLVGGKPGNAQVLSESYSLLYRLREKPGILIFPGFFGYNKNGDILTFSRSGSDITGAVLARGVEAELYENFTDVDAVFSVNPNFVSKPKGIRELTYREMRELSYSGFTVIHDEALMPAFQAEIPVLIKNTNNPSVRGTRIVNERENTNGPVIGIASDTGFCSIYVSKYLMNKQIGFGRKFLQVFEDLGLSYEHTPSGIDDLTVIMRESQLTESIKNMIIKRINQDLEPDSIKIEHHLALIMIVGEGMRLNIGTAARASKALAEANINIEMINQGASEVSMMFGVKEVVEARAVQALYHEFFEAENQKQPTNNMIESVVSGKA